MAFTINYTTLFEIIIDHDYFLDSGKIKFPDLPAELQIQQMERYSYTDFIEVVPTEKTRETLKNQRMIIRKRGNNFKIVASTDAENKYKPVIPIDNKLELHFVVRITDRYFPNFTNLEQVPGRIFLFTNFEPEPKPEPPTSPFPLMKLMPVGAPQSLITDEFIATQEVSDKLTAGMSEMDKMAMLGMVVVRMEADSSEYNITNLATITPKQAATLKSAYLRFKIQFENKKRYWKYKKQLNNTSAVSAEALPLTKYGFIEIKPATDLVPPPPDPEAPPNPFYPNTFYPNPLVSALEVVGTTTYSVIFI